MSIHYKNGSGLEEFASKVEFDDSTRVLKVNGVPHQTFNAQVVDKLPSQVDESTFYFVTYDGGTEPPEGGYLTKDDADRYYQPIGNYLSSSLSTDLASDISNAKVLLPTARAIKEYVSAAIQSEMTQVIIDSMYPVGSIYMSVNNSLPPELTAGGMTWTPIAGGQGFWIVNDGDSGLGKHVDGVLPKHTHTYTGATSGGSFAPGAWSGAKASSVGVQTSVGSISGAVSGVSVGNTLRQPSFCIRAWQRTS